MWSKISSNFILTLRDVPEAVKKEKTVRYFNRSFSRSETCLEVGKGRANAEGILKKQLSLTLVRNR